ncbi:MAG: hypothetical protein HOO06_07310 [Bdellovibrionaceae bacterium]|jgi:hypothetical protein|nr:hypothetical protein [Pseudobdellovibrionaceae bacterium]
MASTTCPLCKSPVSNLLKISSGMKVALESTGQASSLPPEVCDSCYDSLTGQVSKGVKLRVEEEAKAKNKVMLWKNRVNLVKQGRQLMAQRAFTEAAVSYQKYIKVLEIVYDLKPGQLSPKIFSNSSKSKELTVITTVYWDLLRIYDTSPRYHKKMDGVAKKLLEFGAFCPIFPDIVRKADSFSRKAKNKDAMKRFLKQTNFKRGCFVATSAFDSYLAPEVIFLREFRDQKLLPTFTGRVIIRVYYAISPVIASFMNANKSIKPIVRMILQQIIKNLKKIS